MCLNVLRCLQCSTEEGDDQDQKESSHPHKRPPTEEHARVYTNGKAFPYNNETAHSGEQHAKTEEHTEAKGLTKRSQQGAPDSQTNVAPAVIKPHDAGEKSPIGDGTDEASSRKAQPKASYTGQPKNGRGESLHEATIPDTEASYGSKAKTPHGQVTYASQDDTAHGRNACSFTHPDAASNYMKTSQAEGITYKGQPKTSHVDDGSSRAVKYSARADVGMELEPKSGGSKWSSEYRLPSSP